MNWTSRWRVGTPNEPDRMYVQSRQAIGADGQPGRCQDSSVCLAQRTRPRSVGVGVTRSAPPSLHPEVLSPLVQGEAASRCQLYVVEHPRPTPGRMDVPLARIARRHAFGWRRGRS